MLNKEFWEDVKGYEGLYQVSNTGKVRKTRFINNITNKEKVFELSKKLNNKGYCIVTFYKDGKHITKLLHRIIAETFIDNPHGYKEINHIDGNKENNAIDNLEWVTRNYNVKHSYAKGLRKHWALGKYGSYNNKSISVNMLNKDTNEIIKTFGSLVEASQYIGANSSGSISKCCKGKLKTHKGYRWEYAYGKNS